MLFLAATDACMLRCQSIIDQQGHATHQQSNYNNDDFSSIIKNNLNLRYSKYFEACSPNLSKYDSDTHKIYVLHRHRFSFYSSGN